MYEICTICYLYVIINCLVIRFLHRCIASGIVLVALVHYDYKILTDYQPFKLFLKYEGFLHYNC